ncbi:hypothetical protein [Amycolatopsis pigmentata]|uniref:MYXO-CTERM domain-containing protein n=1 Tax=Amycolatopsis pigmentata TaxID=450801 RepID=A0ABW5G4E8_9PSEU
MLRWKNLAVAGGVLRWRTLAVAVVVGIAVVTAVWWAGPGALGVTATGGGDTTQATVTAPAACTDANPTETVRFEHGGQNQTGTLDACGHDRDDRVSISIPADFGAGSTKVHLADVVQGHSDLRRPLGLALLALSCLGGGTYAFLVLRGPRREPALA